MKDVRHHGKSRMKKALTASLLTAAALAASCASGDGMEKVRGAPEIPEASAQPPATPSAMGLPNIAALFEAQKDKVVAIQTEGVPLPPQRTSFGFMRGGRGEGSGFVVDPAGYIVTNNHVVEGARQITVKMADGSSFDAELVGADPVIDIALLKIDAGRRLPAVELGSSRGLPVGSWVVAVGNPFGLDYSVATGIVSAHGRNIGAGPYDNFIQIDLSINPGNSGGPLFNLDGEVIGVNTAVIRRGQGIGFAVPIDMVEDVIGQLKEQGHVTRGYIGVGPQALDDNLAESFGVDRNAGVLIGSIEDGGPADRAGLRAGDVIASFEGEPVETVLELLLAVAETSPGDTASCDIIRDGKPTKLGIEVAQRPRNSQPESRPTAPHEEGSSAELGVRVFAINEGMAQDLGVAPGEGVMVQSVMPTKPVARVLHAHDVIMRVGAQRVDSPADLERALAKIPRGEMVRMRVIRGGQPIFVAVRR